MIAIIGNYLKLVFWILMTVQSALSGGGRTGAPAHVPSFNTWFIRADDGSSSLNCDGLTNAAYPGTGIHQHCAVGSIVYLTTDNTTAATPAWITAPGDKIKYGDMAVDQMGNKNGGGGIVWLYCTSDTSGCVIPPFPDRTTIEGVNSTSCVNPLASANRIRGVGNGLFEILNFQSTTDVTMNCVMPYQEDDCSAVVGSGQCINGTNNWVQHAIRIQYLSAQGPTRLTLRNIAIVGIASQCILGSKFNLSSGDTSILDNVQMYACGGAGWDWDGGGCATACKSIGGVTFTNSVIAFAGCVNSVFPVPTSASAILPDWCAGQSNGGYGDGLGIGVPMGNVNLTICRNSFYFNIQDALDTLHGSDAPGDHANVIVCFNVTNGNGGQMLKFGAADSNTGYANNLNGACAEMSLTTMAPMNTWPTSYHTNLNFSDLCRASDQLVFALKNGSTTTFIANTVTGQNTTGYDVGCAIGLSVCTVGTVIKFQDNITIAYANPLNGGTFASGWFENGLSGGGNSDPLGNAGSLMNHNFWFNQHNGCPQSTFDSPGTTCGTTISPLLVDQGAYTIDPHLQGGSPAIGAGILTFVTQDLFGNPYLNPPAIGAVQ